MPSRRQLKNRLLTHEREQQIDRVLSHHFSMLNKICIGVLVGLTLFFSFVGLMTVKKWFYAHAYEWQIPISLRSPVIIRERGKLPTPTPKPKTQGGAIQEPRIAIVGAALPQPPPTDNLSQMICKIFGKDCGVAIAIAMAESHLNCNAVSPTNDHGLFQINGVHMAKFAGSSPYDCAANIRVAYQIYQQSGWEPWSVFTNGSYLQFL